MALNDDAYQPCTIIMQEALTTKGFVGKNFYANHGAVFNGQNTYAKLPSAAAAAVFQVLIAQQKFLQPTSTPYTTYLMPRLITKAYYKNR